MSEWISLSSGSWFFGVFSSDSTTVVDPSWDPLEEGLDGRLDD